MGTEPTSPYAKTDGRIYSPEFDLDNLRTELSACRREIERLRRENALLRRSNSQAWHELDRYKP